MNRSVRWLMHRRDHRQSREPGATMFRGLRVRLTLWYSSVLAAAFVLCGVALYFGVQYLLFSPVQTELSNHAQMHTEQLLSDSLRACSSTTLGPPPINFGQMPISELVACFDRNATLLLAENTTKLPSAFLSNTLATK